MNTSTTRKPACRLRRRNDPANPALVRIVLVDGEKSFVKITETVIRAKYDVVVASFTTGIDVWRELEQRDPDLLITGGIIPGLHGEELVRGLMLRKVTYPILVTSGLMAKEYVLSWFPENPEISFLAKPFTFEDLYAEFDKHFEPALGDSVQ